MEAGTRDIYRKAVANTGSSEYLRERTQKSLRRKAHACFLWTPPGNPGQMGGVFPITRLA